MAVPELFRSLEGQFTGSNRLFMDWTPENPIRDSASDASVSASVAGDNFWRLDYDWVFEENRKSGSMVVCFAKDGVAEIAWFDSFHQSGGFMVSKGMWTDSAVDASGTYSVPGHPAWGWRTVVDAVSEGEFTFKMYNISPEGESYDAVEARFTRKS